MLDLPDLSAVELTGEGWHRFAILAPDCVVLLPRSHRWVPGLEREAAALPLLEQYGIAAPRLIARLDDEELWPYPVSVISRGPWRTWAAVQDRADRERWQQMLAELAELIAGCHRIDVAAVPETLRSSPPASPDPLERTLWHVEDYLRPGVLEELCRSLADAALLSAHRAGVWMKIMSPCLDMPSTFAHRDLNEGQIMINSDGAVAGLIDWESAGVQHPLSDLDFGGWGPGVWQHEPEMSVLRKGFWRHYVRARGGDLPDWLPVQLFMTIIGAPPPEGHTTAWTEQRRDRTIANLRAVDAMI
ncbi:Phosphotransferase enzyme family protein [Microlunatus soli]|uniref:Phosphotransferase enzyme family protein n=1 Tax=Microlunatus soli TaxID=630515 RepID=A0A1H1SDU0_9ACTN|nr:Phosphotransferase enzyme family protein [Microlunatus soli]